MCGVTIISSDNDPKDKLGVARCAVPKRPCDLRAYVADALNNKNSIAASMNRKYIPATALPPPRSNSLDQDTYSTDSTGDSEVFTKFLTDSSTISIPITSSSQPQYTQSSLVPKYKTMPSPTRSNTILPGANCLNEIFEEGTDVGSSDSATTTPRPSARHAHYINNRTQSQGSVVSSSTTASSTAQRRSKFHKTRTASCSSSDASDDDSENRKKRAHKIVDSTKPIQAQRRDSHDDSSDSQDPGNATSSGSNTTTYPIQVISGNGGSGGSAGSGGSNVEQQKQDQSGSNSRQKSGHQMGFRRHRAGRRRAGETRLRESQSLNRITEVQESELPFPNSLVCSNPQPTVATAAVTTNQHHQKPKGFSARLFHGFRRSDNQASTPDTPPTPVVPAEEEVEMVLGVELAKALKVTESKSSSATKKLKMLGRYFQVNSNVFHFFLN